MVFHNLSNYDAHLFIKKMFIKNPEERLECIPNNEEKYISFRKFSLVALKCFDDTVHEGKLVTYTAKSEDDDVAQIFFWKN